MYLFVIACFTLLLGVFMLSIYNIKIKCQDQISTLTSIYQEKKEEEPADDRDIGYVYSDGSSSSASNALKQ